MFAYGPDYTSVHQNTTPFRSNNSVNYPAHSFNRNETHLMSRSTPASHLNTSDDYVLDIALLNDSLAIQQAGYTVQKHRNQNHRNQRHIVEDSSLERYPKRSVFKEVLFKKKTSFGIGAYCNGMTAEITFKQMPHTLNF